MNERHLIFIQKRGESIGQKTDFEIRSL